MRQQRPAKSPPAPPHLTPEASSWWRSTCEAFEFDEHHLRLLRLACEAWDRCQQARVILAEKGLTYDDRFGLRVPGPRSLWSGTPDLPSPALCANWAWTLPANQRPPPARYPHLPQLGDDMPPRKRFLTRNRREWTSSHKMQLRAGCDFFGEAWGGAGDGDSSALCFTSLATIPADTLEEMYSAWELHSDEIEADAVSTFPGTRPWFWWVRFALPESPRRRIDPTHGADASLRAPWGRAWESDEGHENSLAYLVRTTCWRPARSLRFAAMTRFSNGSSTRDCTPAKLRPLSPGRPRLISAMCSAPTCSTTPSLQAAAAWEARSEHRQTHRRRPARTTRPDAPRAFRLDHQQETSASRWRGRAAEGEFGRDANAVLVHPDHRGLGGRRPTADGQQMRSGDPCGVCPDGVLGVQSSAPPASSTFGRWSAIAVSTAPAKKRFPPRKCAVAREQAITFLPEIT